jgi:hypothetical protein
MKVHVLRRFITHLLVHIHQKTKFALEIAAKFANLSDMLPVPCVGRWVFARLGCFLITVRTKIKTLIYCTLWGALSRFAVSRYRVLATVKNSALNAVFPITLRSQFPNLGQPKNSYRNSIIFSTSDNRPVPYISLIIWILFNLSWELSDSKCC